MWNFFIAALISLAVVYATRPKPQNAPPPSLDQIKTATADAGRPIAVLFGTKEIVAVNCVWYGDISTKPIKVKGGKK